MKKAQLMAAITAAQALPPSEAPSTTTAGSSGTEAASATMPPQGEGNPGLPIPGCYGVDTLALMVQDPTHIFAYWEITPASLAAARRILGEDGLPVLLVYSKYGQEQRVVDLSGGNYYLCISPDTSYRADLGLRDRKGRVHILASSETVHTPRNSISGRKDETWLGVDDSFRELLEMAGLETAGGSSSQLAGGGGAVNLDSLSSHSLSSAALQHRPPKA